MAIEVQRTVQQWSLGGTRIKWGAIFAGLFVGVATQMVLTLLGLAIGAWSIDLQEAKPMGSIPLGTGIWSAISMLIAAFVGGYVAARMGGIYSRPDGMFHGIVVWAVNWLVFAWLATTAMSFMVGGVFNALGTAIKSVSQGVGSAVTRAAGGTNVDISMDDVRRQIESVLQATGKKELQPGEIKKDVGTVTGKAQAGKPLDQVADSAWKELQQKLMTLDRDAAINVMVNKFGMSEAQARQVVQSTIGAIAPIKETVQNVKEQSVDIANTAISRIGSAAWWLFLLALLTLGLSAGGGAVGINEEVPLAEVSGQTYQTEARRTAG